MEYPISAAEAPALERAAFIRRTYGHLAAAILAFVGLEALLLNTPGIEQIIAPMIGGRWSWLIVLGAFMVVSWIATSWAQSSTSIGMQYAGLALYVVAEAIIFLPILYIADRMSPGAIKSAGIMTLAVFAGLTVAVLVTGKDYSFLGPVLSIGFMVAFGFILASVLFGFSLGTFFIFALIALACGAIIYQTSNVMHHYSTTQHVAAALALFASVALLFWYILQLFMNRD
jgi:hypothetical protein